MTSSISRELIEQCIFRINENTQRIIRCLEELNEADLWQSPNQSSNSIGNLILHLCGNITQYIISALGGAEDVRMRDHEFLAGGGFSGNNLSAHLQAVAIQATAIIKDADDGILLNSYAVQGFDLSGIGIIIHVTEHYSYHTGQIVFQVKSLKNKDLGFYAAINLNAKNKTHTPP